MMPLAFVRWHRHLHDASSHQKKQAASKPADIKIMT